MASPTPWQVANAGQRLPTVRTTRVIFSHGTTPWPYAPHYEVDTVDPNAATPNGVYGANGPTNGSGNGGTGGGGSGGSGGSGSGGSGSGGSGSGGSGSGGSCGCGSGSGNCGLPAGQGGGSLPG